MKITQLFGIIIISCLVGENLSTSTLCTLKDKVYVDTDGVSCYLKNIDYQLMQLDDLGLSAVKRKLTGTQASYVVVLPAALEAARLSFVGKEVLIPEKNIFTQKITNGDPHLGCHLWNLLINYFKEHYSAKNPLVPEFFRTEMEKYLEGTYRDDSEEMAELKGKKRAELVNSITSCNNPLDKIRLKTFGRILVLLNAVHAMNSVNIEDGILTSLWPMLFGEEKIGPGDFNDYTIAVNSATISLYDHVKLEGGVVKYTI